MHICVCICKPLPHIYICTCSNNCINVGIYTHREHRTHLGPLLPPLAAAALTVAVAVHRLVLVHAVLAAEVPPAAQALVVAAAPVLAVPVVAAVLVLALLLLVRVVLAVVTPELVALGGPLDERHEDRDGRREQPAHEEGAARALVAGVELGAQLARPGDAGQVDAVHLVCR